MDWEDIIDEQSLAALLPPSHAHVARPVKEGLVVFLSGLPKPIQLEILAEQASIPLASSVSERLGLLARKCPVLHKLGQTLARDKRLAEELREQLRPLETLVPTTPLETIRASLAAEFGSLAEHGIRLLPPAIAEASVAVVIPFELVTEAGPKHGVFKLLKPGIEERLDLELHLLTEVGAHLDAECHRLGIPELDYQDTFNQIRTSLSSEVDLALEQRNLHEARAAFADVDEIIVPALLDCCTPRVTAMEFVEGVKITDHASVGREEKNRVARVVARALVAHPLFSSDSRAMFHSDPHAGNLLYTSCGRVALLDWSLVGHLSERERVATVQILLGAITHHADKIVRVLENLATRPVACRQTLRQVVENWLKKMRWGMLPGLAWLVGMLDDAVQTGRLGISKDMMFFRKSLLTLEGVVHDLSNGRVDMDDVLLLAFAGQFYRELPLRWFAEPTSRMFPTRLSTADLVETFFQLGLLLPRCVCAELEDRFGMLTHSRCFPSPFWQPALPECI